jgi:hypothetical protein
MFGAEERTMLFPKPEQVAACCEPYGVSPSPARQASGVLDSRTVTVAFGCPVPKERSCLLDQNLTDPRAVETSPCPGCCTTPVSPCSLT